MSLLMREPLSLRDRIVGAVLIAAVLATPALATERGRAERLYTKGLAELHAGRTDAALALFDQAVAADPKDVHGIYYRALGYGHAGRYEQAVTDLRVVVAANDPAIERARLELGYALFRLERYDEAAAELEIASKVQGRSNGEAMMLLGIVETRRGNHDAARAALARVESLDPDRALPARYYQGLAEWRAGDTDAAVEHFTWVSTQGGESPYAKEAAAFLERMQDGGPSTTRRYRLYGGLAFEYDSNVVLAPSDDALSNGVLGISQEDDGRAVLRAGGQYLAAAASNYRVSVGYDFLQTLHFDLEEFNVQTHRVGGQGEYLIGPVSMGVAAGYEHSLLEDESLLNGGTVLPWIRVDQGALGQSEAYYRMRARNYVLAPYSAERDSINNAFGARQFFWLGSRNRSVIVGYRYDRDSARRIEGEEWDYGGHQFEAGLDLAFADDWRAILLYAYKLEDYSAQSDDAFGDDRDDDEHLVVTRLEKRLHEYVWLAGSYIYHRNDSTQGLFDYSRHVTSLGVELRY